MTPFEAFQRYISLKNHFCNKKYDYFKYQNKTRATIQSFYKRRDRYFFEKLSRQKSDEEIINFFVANFALSFDPSSLWIGDILKEGEENYNKWKKVTQSLFYTFKSEIQNLIDNHKFIAWFDCSDGHPILLKKYLAKDINLETLVIINKILGFSKDFDEKLNDPIWQIVSQKLVKYDPFIVIDMNKYRGILKETVVKK
jgi:hypothetical protein